MGLSPSWSGEDFIFRSPFVEEASYVDDEVCPFGDVGNGLWIDLGHRQPGRRPGETKSLGRTNMGYARAALETVAMDDRDQPPGPPRDADRPPPPDRRGGPDADRRGPPPRDGRGDAEQDRRGPPDRRGGPDADRRGPPPRDGQRGPDGDRRGPPPRDGQRGPDADRRGPPPGPPDDGPEVRFRVFRTDGPNVTIGPPDGGPGVQSRRVMKVGPNVMYGPPDGMPGEQPPGMGPQGLWLSREADPEMYKLLKEDADLGRQSFDLAQQYRRAVGDQREKIKDLIAKTVNKHFEVRQQRRVLELKRLEGELKRLQESLDRRAKARKELVEKRVSDLLGHEDEARF